MVFIHFLLLFCSSVLGHCDVKTPSFIVRLCDYNAVWSAEWGGPKQACICRRCPDPPCARAILRGKGAARCKLGTFSPELCKTAEPIEMPFGEWTPVGPRKLVLDGVYIAATWRIRLDHPSAAAMRPFCQITLNTCYYSLARKP